MTSLNSEPSYIRYNWYDVNRACKLIHDKLITCNFTPSYIIGLTRGGLIPATILSHKLDLPLHPLNISLRDDNRVENKLWMCEDAIQYKSILIVDDINDSGATFRTLKENWEKSIPGNWHKIWHYTVQFAVIDNNLASAAKVDYFYNAIDKSVNNVWVIYPWEKQ